VRFSLVPWRLLIDNCRCPLSSDVAFPYFLFFLSSAGPKTWKVQYFVYFISLSICPFFHDFPIISHFPLSFTFTFPSLRTFARFIWRYATSFQWLALSKPDPPDVTSRCMHTYEIRLPGTPIQTWINW
jgi:hypothetical protein